MSKKEKLINIFKQFLTKDSKIRREALTFKKKEGKLFEQNLKEIFDRNDIKYTYQPNGTQQFPDFILTDFTRKINIECKTSAKGNIVWNSGIAHKDMILLYASGHSESNDITFFLGKELMPNEEPREKIKNWAKIKNKNLGEEFDTTFMGDISKNWKFSLREVYTDKISNFLKNPKRSEWENEVIDFLSNLEIKNN